MEVAAPCFEDFGIGRNKLLAHLKLDVAKCIELRSHFVRESV